MSGGSSAGASALGMSLSSILAYVAKLVLSISLLMVALSAMVPLLPDDPFRLDIMTISGTFQQWSDFINWFIPSGFIVTSSLFAVECKMFFFILRLLAQQLHVNFFLLGTSEGETIEDWYE